MSSLTAQEATLRPRQLRQAVQHDGQVVALTFHGKPYGYVVPADQWHALTHDTDQPKQEEAKAS